MLLTCHDIGRLHGYIQKAGCELHWSLVALTQGTHLRWPMMEEPNVRCNHRRVKVRVDLLFLHERAEDMNGRIVNGQV